MALTIVHSTVASDPQDPLLDHTSWNANHTITGSIAYSEITGSKPTFGLINMIKLGAIL